MNAFIYYVTYHIQDLISEHAYLTCIFFDTQRPKRRSIEILVENELTEQTNNETAQQVSERN
jgi:hypothetical protein